MTTLIGPFTCHKTISSVRQTESLHANLADPMFNEKWSSVFARISILASLEYK